MGKLKEKASKKLPPSLRPKGKHGPHSDHQTGIPPEFTVSGPEAVNWGGGPLRQEDRDGQGGLVMRKCLEAGSETLVGMGLEQEADRAAEAVVQGGRNVQVGLGSKGRVAREGHPVDGATLASIESKAGTGEPMEEQVQERMEEGFGEDFSTVRIHKDGEANALAAKLDARAFTYGEDVFFNEGEGELDSEESMELMAHELAHVVQQRQIGNHVLAKGEEKTYHYPDVFRRNYYILELEEGEAFHIYQDYSHSKGVVEVFDSGIALMNGTRIFVRDRNSRWLVVDVFISDYTNTYLQEKPGEIGHLEGVIDLTERDDAGFSGESELTDVMIEAYMDFALKDPKEYVQNLGDALIKIKSGKQRGAGYGRLLEILPDETRVVPDKTRKRLNKAYQAAWGNGQSPYLTGDLTYDLMESLLLKHKVDQTKLQEIGNFFSFEIRDKIQNQLLERASRFVDKQGDFVVHKNSIGATDYKISPKLDATILTDKEIKFSLNGGTIGVWIVREPNGHVQYQYGDFNDYWDRVKKKLDMEYYAFRYTPTQRGLHIVKVIFIDANNRYKVLEKRFVAKTLWGIGEAELVRNQDRLKLGYDLNMSSKEAENHRNFQQAMRSYMFAELMASGLDPEVKKQHDRVRYAKRGGHADFVNQAEYMWKITDMSFAPNAFSQIQQIKGGNPLTVHGSGSYVRNSHNPIYKLKNYKDNHSYWWYVEIPPGIGKNFITGKPDGTWTSHEYLKPIEGYPNRVSIMKQPTLGADEFDIFFWQYDFYKGDLNIVCEEFDPQMNLVNKHVFLQRLMTKKNDKAIERGKSKQYYDKVKKGADRMRGTPVRLNAVFVNEETGDCVPLHLYVGHSSQKDPKDDKHYEIVLVDHTVHATYGPFTVRSNEHYHDDLRRKGLERFYDAWKLYPTGRVMVAGYRRNYNYNYFSYGTGANAESESVSSWVSFLSFCLFIAGGISMLIPGGWPAALAFFELAAWTGAASGAIGIGEQLTDGKPMNWEKFLLDLGMIAGVFLPMSGASLLEQAEVRFLSGAMKSGQRLHNTAARMLELGAAINTVQGIYLSGKAWVDLETLLNSNMDEDGKYWQLIQLFSQLLLSGHMAISSHQSLNHPLMKRSVQELHPEVRALLSEAELHWIGKNMAPGEMQINSGAPRYQRSQVRQQIQYKIKQLELPKLKRDLAFIAELGPDGLHKPVYNKAKQSLTEVLPDYMIESMHPLDVVFLSKLNKPEGLFLDPYRQVWKGIEGRKGITDFEAVVLELYYNPQKYLEHSFAEMYVFYFEGKAPVVDNVPKWQTGEHFSGENPAVLPGTKHPLLETGTGDYITLPPRPKGPLLTEQKVPLELPAPKVEGKIEGKGELVPVERQPVSVVGDGHGVLPGLPLPEGHWGGIKPVSGPSNKGGLNTAGNKGEIVNAPPEKVTLPPIDVFLPGKGSGKNYEPPVPRQDGKKMHSDLLETLLLRLDDMRINAGPMNKEWVSDSLVNEIAYAFMYMSNIATYKPVQGGIEGPVSHSQTSRPLTYSRSGMGPSKHPNEFLFGRMVMFLRNRANYTLPEGEVINLHKLITPVNKEFKGQLENTLNAKEVPGRVPKINSKEHMAIDPTKQGDPIPLELKIGDFEGPHLGASGIRANNPEFFQQMVKNLLDAGGGNPQVGITILMEFIIREYFPGAIHKPKQYKISPKKLSTFMDTLRAKWGNQAFTESLGQIDLRGKANGASSKGTDLFLMNNKYRIQMAENIVKVLSKEKFAYLEVSGGKGAPFFFLTPTKPPHTSAKYELKHSYHKFGYNQAVLSYLIRLINNEAAALGLPALANRRQSYGFSNITVTDAGLSIRLSTGELPAAFGELIMEAVFKLDREIGMLSPETMQRAFTNTKSEGRRYYLIEDPFKGRSKQQDALEVDAPNFDAYLNAVFGNRKGSAEQSPLLSTGSHMPLSSPSYGQSQKQAYAKEMANMDSISLSIGKSLQNLAETARADLATAMKQKESMDVMQKRSVNLVADLLLQAESNLALALSDPLTANLQAIEIRNLLIQELTAMRVAFPNLKDGRSPSFRVREILQARLKSNGIAVGVKDLNVYLADSGEQAGIASLISVISESAAHAKSGRVDQAGNIMVESPYFELRKFLEQSKYDVAPAINESSIATLADIFPSDPSKGGEIGAVLGGQNQIVKHVDAAVQANKGKSGAPDYTLVIDITNAGFTHPEVLAGIKAWKNAQAAHPNLRLVLFSSLVKLEQFGVDKLQAGRIIVFGKNLAGLDKVSAAASNKTSIDFLNMMLDIAYGRN